MGEQSARILIVDDERFFREAIRDILAADGFDCIEVDTGEQALDRVDDTSLGVVILDIRLPGIDGIEVLRRLREIRPTLRVIMLSASTGQELVLAALRLGACDYLAKPLHDEELVLAVRRAAESYVVATDRGRLRERLDCLVESVEELAGRASGASRQERLEMLRQGAVEAAAAVLGAEKTSLMLLNEEGTELRVAATVGRDLSVEEMDPVPLGQGMAGRALENSEPLVVEAMSGDERFADRANVERYRSESFAVAPLVAGDRPLGVLCATDRVSGGSFGLEDLSLLRLLATQISEFMAVGHELVSAAEDDESAQAVPEAVERALDLGDGAGDRDRDAELARLVCDAMVNDVEPERVIGAVLQPLVGGLPAAPVSLYLVDAATGVLRCEGQRDGGVRADRSELPKNVGLTGLVLQTGHLVATQEPQSDSRFDPEVDTPEDGGVGPMLCLPLRLRGKVVGVFRAFLPPDVEVSARTGEVLAAALSAAVRNVLLYRSLLETIEDVAEARREARGRESARQSAQAERHRGWRPLRE